ncbi:hypothetical protein J5N97_002102 [Dioscorea zingiberensis]|uniref:Uncharacterized protein n=1 Tax=Dioscorea zingiberensis TaxID=325984 RepID=A0A9D5HP98_9LILI|nr:hypothetical protein J5N97_002102 [Dioscorea zingiberensis]
MPPPLFFTAKSSPNIIIRLSSLFVLYKSPPNIIILSSQVLIPFSTGRGRSMKSSPVFPKDEAGSGNAVGYNPQDDFSKVGDTWPFFLNGNAQFAFDDISIACVCVRARVLRIPRSLLPVCDQFLEEARKHANDIIMNSARPSLNSVEKYIPSESRKKSSQKSWKNTLLLFWWKSEKKKKKSNADNAGTTLERKKRHSASGPLSSAGKERGRGGGLGGRPMSGPLSSCFTPTRAEDTEVPYMCLEQQDYPHRIHSHGPLYKVT